MAASRIGSLFSVILMAMALATLAGCGVTWSATAFHTPAALRGTVHGGNQPVSGSSVQLYAVGTTGTGSAALPLLGKPVQSDSSGNFSIPASYFCPSSTSQVYVVAHGGKPAPLAGAENPALELTAMLGPCDELSSFNSISVNEVTTIGSVWPLAAFMTSLSHLGYTPDDSSFLNAVSSVPEFINIAQGNSPGKPTATTYFAENSKLYSLADLLAHCVDSSGGSAGDGSPCGLLFSIATLPGGNPPTDTATAAMRIAQNPRNNVLDIFGLATADTPYQPALTTAPPDWTLTLSYVVATPSISLATGSYTGTQEVTISDSTAGSAIHYTTDGTAPTSSSPLYAGALSINVSSTLQAVAVLDGSLSALASSMLTITSAHPPVKLAFLHQPSNASIGNAISPAVQVVAEDSSGNTATTGTNPITLALISSQGPAVTSWTAVPQNGIATFSNLTVNAAGTGYTLVATSSGLTSATSAGFNIGATAGGSAPAPIKLAFLQQPSNASLGATISPAVRVAVEDSSGNTATTDTNPITLAVMSSHGSAVTSWSAVPQNGIATFINLTVNTAGTGYTLVAASPGLTSATSAGFTISATSGGSAPVPVKLAFLQQPSSASTGATISPAVQVAVEDSNGNTVSAATNPITLALVGGTGLAGTLTAVPQNGIATFSNLSVSTPGSGYTLLATSSGLGFANSASFTMSAPGNGSDSSPVKLAFLVQPSNALTQAVIGPAVQVSVENATGSPVTTAGNSVTLTLTSGSGLEGTLTATAQNGVATFSNLAVSTTGSGYMLLASSPGLTSAASTSFTISAPSLGTVQSLGAIPSSQPLAGLGFNLDPVHEWEFQLAAAAGTTHVRFQCSWVTNETQTPPPQNTNTATKYLLEPNCQTGLALSRKYGMHPTIIAAYGSPYHSILNVVAPAGAPAGATAINVQFASGVGGDTMASLAPFYDTIIASNGSQISALHSYAGALVIGVQLTDATHGTLMLASALTSALPADATTLYTINQYLYPPVATFSASDPSVIAFTNYATFIAQSIASAGLTGEVELWNEPTWSDDPWDARVNFYDVFPGVLSPGPQAGSLPDFGFVAALQNQTSTIPGVTFIWAGTEKSGDNSVLGLSMLANTGVLFKEPATVVTSESFHPYGNNPEDDIWSPSCLEATIKPYPATPSYFASCNLIPTSTSNTLKAAQETLVQQSQNSSWGIAHSITETGFQLNGGDVLHQARFIMRQFLGFQADGVTPIEFYRLYDTSSAELTFTDPATQNPLPSYTAIAGLMADIATIKNAPVAQPSPLSSVVSFSGTYPLDTVHIVGSRPGDTANSEIFALWQQSSVGIGGIWATLAQPNAAPVTLNIPAGSVVSAVLNLDTRQPVSYTTSGQQITLGVSDDPIEVLVVPAP